MELGRPYPVTGEPLRRDRLGDEHDVRGAAPELVLHRRVLVVEGRAAGDPERSCRHRQVMRRVREGDVEAAVPGPAHQRAEAGHHRRRLDDPRAPAVRAHDGRLHPVQPQQLDVLAELPRRDLDLGPALAQHLDERPEHEHVRRPGDVDPDSHRFRSLGAGAGQPGACCRCLSGISRPYGHASAGRVLRGRRPEELLPGRGAARGHPAGRQPAGARSRGAAGTAAPRPLGSPGRADGGGPAPLPECATDAPARGAPSGGRCRDRRRQAHGDTRPRRLHRSRSAPGAAPPLRVPAGAPRPARCPLDLGHARCDRARCRPRG